MSMAIRSLATVLALGFATGCSGSGGGYYYYPTDGGGADGAIGTCTMCNGACTVLSLDPRNCGRCGNACATGSSCVNGACQSGNVCPSGQTMCPTGCTPLAFDPANCGSCGNACATGTPCVQGQCMTGNGCTGAGLMMCGANCVNVLSDPNDCGSCGNACASGICQNGACGASCSDGIKDGTESDVDCGGTCPACVNGRHCFANADCQSGDCMTGVCTQPVVPSTIASMRNAGAAGTFTLANVVVLGITPSLASPRLFVQDQAGGDFSAVVAICSSTSVQYPCPSASAVAQMTVGTVVTITGSYARDAAGADEVHATSVTAVGSATPPPPFQFAISDVVPNGNLSNAWYARVVVDLGGDTLLPYDWSPIQMQKANATACFFYYGFAMIPASLGVPSGLASPTGNTADPTPIASPNASEVLIGTDFYKGFTVVGDCRCAAQAKETLMTAQSTLTGTLSGILVFYPEQATPSVGYQYIAPQSNADAPITNTM